MSIPEGRALFNNNTWKREFSYTDPLGNIRVSFRASGDTLQKVGETAFDPFGVVLQGAGFVNGTPNKFEMQDHEKEMTFGLNRVNFGARVYNPTIGRFDRVDPLSDVSRRLSTYSYVNNNPMRFIDPDGLESVGADGLTPSQWLSAGGDADKEKEYREENKEKERNVNKIRERVKVITRQEWGAKKPIRGKGREWESITGSPAFYYNTITVHHSGNRENYLEIQELQRMEQRDGYADIPYHFAIDKNGNVFEGRPINIKGSHVKGRNTGNIGIVLLSGLDSENRGLDIVDGTIEFFGGSGNVSNKMIESLLNLTLDLNAKYGIKYFGGHNEVLKERFCPGNIGMEWVTRIREGLRMQAPKTN